MKYRPLGPSGIEASAVALGCWAIGGWMWGGQEEKESIEAVRAAVDNGVTLIDTAPIYGFGRSEEFVGRALEGIRDKVVLATKCGLVWDTKQGNFKFRADDKGLRKKGGDIEVYEYLAPKSIREELESSLKRLHTDCIDLYQTHWQDPTTPIEDTMAELVKMKEEGKIRAIGACNVKVDHLEKYRAGGLFSVAQVKYSMLDRKMETDVLPYCRENGLAVLAYSPLELGLLTGKFGPNPEFNEGDLRNDNPRFKPENIKRVNRMLESLRPIAEKYAATFAQLTIAWTISRPGLTHALVGARNVKQAEENAAAGAIELNGEEMKQINQAISDYFKEKAG